MRLPLDTTRSVSLGEALGGVHPKHERLAAGVAAARALSQRLELAHVKSFGFELPLDSTAPVDFGLCIGPTVEARRGLVACAGNFCHDSVVPELARRLADENDRLAGRIAEIFFEFDRDANGAFTARPSLFARLRVPATHAEDVPRLREALAALGAHADAEPLLDDVGSMLGAGGHAAVTDVGVMSGRASRSSRVSIELFSDPRRLVAASRRSESAVALVAACRALAAGQPNLRLHLDATSPVIGVEQSFGVGSGARALWRAWLDRLAGSGLMRPEELPPLLEWWGPTRVARGERWPFVLRRELGHVKLVFVGDRFTRAKAYLVASPTFSLFLL